MSTIDQILEAYERPSKQILVALPKGEVLEFRQFEDADEFEAFLESAREFVKLFTEGKALTKEMAAVKPKRQKTMLKAHLISFLSVEPKINQVAALSMAKKNETIFNHLYEEIERQRGTYVAIETESQIEQGKGD